MTIETLMQALIDALNANTAALNGRAAPAPAAKPVAKAKPAPEPEAEDEEDDEEEAPAKPAPKKAPPPAPAKKAPKPAAEPDEDKVAKAREMLKKVLDSKGANTVRALLGQVGAAKLSEVTEDNIDALLEAINESMEDQKPAKGKSTALFD